MKTNTKIAIVAAEPITAYRTRRGRFVDMNEVPHSSQNLLLGGFLAWQVGQWTDNASLQPSQKAVSAALTIPHEGQTLSTERPQVSQNSASFSIE